MGKEGVSQMKTSHHHILSAGEGVNGNSQTYLWINAVEFIVDLSIPSVLPAVLNVIRDIVTEVRAYRKLVQAKQLNLEWLKLS